MQNYGIQERNLCSKATPVSLNEQKSPTFVAIRQEHFNMEAATSLELKDAQANDEAGISVYMNTTTTTCLVRQNKDKSRSVVLRYKLGELEHIEKEMPLNSGKGNIELNIKSDINLLLLYRKRYLS